MCHYSNLSTTVSSFRSKQIMGSRSLEVLRHEVALHNIGFFYEIRVKDLSKLTIFISIIKSYAIRYCRVCVTISSCCTAVGPLCSVSFK